MIISEKQIIELMTLLRHSLYCFKFNEVPSLAMDICQLLRTINDQQSEELKVIE